MFDFPVKQDSPCSIYYNGIQNEVELELIHRYYHNSINVIKIDNGLNVCFNKANSNRLQLSDIMK